MKEIKTGTENTASMQVETKDSAIAHGSGGVEVFATPAMVALMEEAAWKSVQPFLEDGFTTVGTEISVKHIRPTPIGEKVRARSVLTAVEGKKLVFSLEASDGRGRIGFGSHTRYVVRDDFFRE